MELARDVVGAARGESAAEPHEQATAALQQHSQGSAAQVPPSKPAWCRHTLRRRAAVDRLVPDPLHTPSGPCLGQGCGQHRLAIQRCDPDGVWGRRFRKLAGRLPAMAAGRTPRLWGCAQFHCDAGRVSLAMKRASSDCLRTPSLPKTFFNVDLAVCSEMPSSCAAPRAVRPLP